MMKHPLLWCVAGALVACSFCFAGIPQRPDSTNSFKVMGYVNNPGIYPFDLDKTTILSALDGAGGEKAGIELKVFVIRKIDDSLTQEINFSSLASLRKHPKSDVPLLPNDEVALMPASPK